MLRGEDVIVLLDLCGAEDPVTVRAVAARTLLPIANVQRSLRRLEEARLIAGRRPLRGNVAEFLRHALPYALPATPGGETRGVPTAWAAEPLASALTAPGPLPPVWADPAGTVRGLAVPPLHRVAPRLAVERPALGEQLALVDAIRMGEARTRTLATRLLFDRIGLGR